MQEKYDSIEFETRLHAHARAGEDILNRILSPALQDGEIARPKRLLDAMRHGVLNGGKRLRPFLVMESTALFDGDAHAALRVAAALECVHCYSLIHDDLPAMDDDDLRRGQPTVHRAFDEAHAILAGDSLLTVAFDIIADPQTDLAPKIQIELVRMLARAAGVGGMAGGQALDLQAETVKPDEAGIITLQAMKTGALIRFACEAGAVIAGATLEERDRLAEYGSAIGLAFQLADDLLDMTADAARMGKATGKDMARGKGTLPAMYGEAWARAQLRGLVHQAEALLGPFGEKSMVLIEAARFIANRTS
jgi:farnesyl diphosphate synthase